MPATTINTERLSQIIPEIAELSEREPLVFTEGDVVTHVLLTYADYRRLIKSGPSLLEAFSDWDGPDLSDIPDDVFENPFGGSEPLPLTKSA